MLGNLPLLFYSSWSNFSQQEENMALKERNIYKRKDGRYEARYIKGRDTDGKAIYASVYARSYTLVREKLQELRKNGSENSLPSSQQTVPLALDEYLLSIRSSIKQSTFGVYQGYLKNHITSYFKSIRCGQLNLNVLQRFVNEKIDSGLSATTVQSIFIFLKTGLKSRCADNIFKVSLPKICTKRIEILTPKDQKLLESVARASDDINMIGITLSLYTGIRIGELCGLTWNDIDFEYELLNVRRTVQRIKNDKGDSKTKVTFLSPKTPSSQRSIPLPNFLITLLKDHKAKAGGNYIISYDGKLIEPRNMQRRFKRILELANLPSVNFHVTRHTFATRALENGFDVKTLSEILGHSSPITTLKKYAHTLDEHKRRSMESLSVLYH